MKCSPAVLLGSAGPLLGGLVENPAVEPRVVVRGIPAVVAESGVECEVDRCPLVLQVGDSFLQ